MEGAATIEDESSGGNTCVSFLILVKMLLAIAVALLKLVACLSRL